MNISMDIFWRLYILCILFISAISNNIAHALPQGGSVIDGQANISQPSDNYLQIKQTTPQVLINWDSFNINANEHTQFIQPDSNSIAINRINPANGTSNILGRLTANGKIFLLNPAGILIGNGAQVNVGSLLATTSDLDIEKYKKLGSIELIPNNNYPNSFVENLGDVTVQNAGFAAFVAPNVVNSGIITAKLGHVELSSGEYFTVDLYGDDLIHFKVPTELINKDLKNTSVIHNGAIYADGGSIVISAENAGNIVSSIINLDGLIIADTINSNSNSNNNNNNQGKIILSNKNGDLYFNSNNKIYARGNNNNIGGYIKAQAENIVLKSNSIIDASGDNGGGNVLIGGNYQGKINNTSEYNAKTVTMEQDAIITADANLTGDGGEVILWSDYNTTVSGYLSAMGGIYSGNGGLIETSGMYSLNILPSININTKSRSNNTYQDGLWLLDPIDMIVSDDLAVAISTALNNNNNVTITTISPPQGQNLFDPVINEDGTPASFTVDPFAINPSITPNSTVSFINFNNPVSWSTNKRFTVKSDGAIMFYSDNAINITGPGHLQLFAGLEQIFDQFYGNFYGKIYKDVSIATLPVIANNNSLVEIYIRPDDFNGQLQPEVSSEVGLYGLTADSSKIYDISGGSQFIEYHYINYKDPLLDPNRTLSSAASLNIAPNIGFALFDNVDVSSLDPGFNGFNGLNYTGHFDGLNNTISNLALTSPTDGGNAGFFKQTDSSVQHQRIKNIVFDNIFVNASPLNPSDEVSAAVLIGQANINTNPLSISNIVINNSTVDIALDTNTNNSIKGIAGSLIGSAVGNNSNLNITNYINNPVNSSNAVSVNNTAVNSSYISGGLIGKEELSGSNINLYGDFIFDNYKIVAAIDTPIANDQTLANNFVNTYAGGILGLSTGDNLILNTNNANLNLTSSASIIATNNLAGQSAAAGGIIAAINANNAQYDFGLIAINDATISATTNFLQFGNPLGTSINKTFAGGVIGNTEPTDITAASNINFNNAIDITVDNLIADINLDFNNNGNGTPTLIDTSSFDFYAYSGGLFGHGIINTLNNPLRTNTDGNININTLPAANITAEFANFAQAASGGLSGSEFIKNYNFNNNTIITNGSFASVTPFDPAGGTLIDSIINNISTAKAYAGGISGVSGLIGQTPTTNQFIYNINPNSINIGSSTLFIVTPQITTSSIGAKASSVSGGLFGNIVSSSNSLATHPIINMGTNTTVLDINFSDNFNITSSITDNNSVTPHNAEFLTNIVAAAAGFGNINNVNINLEKTNFSLGNNGLITTANNNPLGISATSPLQATAGLFAVFYNSDLKFDENNFNFNMNTTNLASNNLDNINNGFAGGVLGYIDIFEETPSLATLGSLNKDYLNEGLNYSSGGSIFTYNAPDPCQGPSGGLCFAAVIFTPPDSGHDGEPGSHTHTTTHTAHEGEHQAHFPHVPHLNTHRHEPSKEENQTTNILDKIYNQYLIAGKYPIIYKINYADLKNKHFIELVPMVFDMQHEFKLYKNPEQITETISTEIYATDIELGSEHH